MNDNAPAFWDPSEEEKLQPLGSPPQGSSPSSNLNWVSVLNFLQKEHTRTMIQEQQWQMQKKILNEKINRLESQLDTNLTINADLVNRIKLLEIALVEARVNNNPPSDPTPQNPKNDKQNQETNTLQKQIQELMQKYEISEKVKNGGHQRFLKQIMGDIGISFKELPSIKEDLQSFQEDLKQKNISNLLKTNFKLRQYGGIVAHLDSVRGLYANKQQNFVVSVSEDCLVKVWNYKAFWQNKDTHLQPEKTFRQHTGPLFCLTGGKNPFNPQQSVFFTGGTEGIIKYWSINNHKPVPTASTVGFWHHNPKNLDEPATIWSLAFNNNNLISSSNDGIVQHYQIKQANLSSNTDLDLYEVMGSYKDQQFKSTCLEWISLDLFVSGCSNAPRAQIWNIHSGKVVQKLLYEIDKGTEPILSEINQAAFCKTKNLIGAACEDGNLRLFNISNNKLIRKIELNHNKSGPLSCIQFLNDWQIVVGSHLGYIYAIDLRNYQIVQQRKNCHSLKYDESIFCLLTRNSKQLLSGGADGVVKHWI